MMCLAAISIAVVTWALVGYSLAFDGDAKIIGGLHYALLNNVGFEPRDGTTIPHLVFFAFQATFCIITTALVSGAVVERMRFGPFLVFAGAVVGARLRRARALGVRRRLAGGAGDAGLRRRRAGRDGLRVLGARGRARRRRAQGLRPPGAAAAQRDVRAARRRAAVVRLVRLQRRQRLLDGQRERARVHEHAADAGLHARRVGHPRRDPRTPGDGDRRRDGDHRRLRRDHARRRVRQPGLGDGARRARRDPELRRRSRGGRARASTRRSTSSRRTASRASPASSSSASSRRSQLERRRRRPVLRRRGSARLAARRGGRGAGLRVRRDVRAPARSSARVMPLRGPDDHEAVGMDIVHHGEEAYATGEGALLIGAEFTPPEEKVPVGGRGERVAAAPSQVGYGALAGAIPARRPTRGEPHEDGDRVHPPRGLRADPGGAARARLSLAVGLARSRAPDARRASPSATAARS